MTVFFKLDIFQQTKTEFRFIQLDEGPLFVLTRMERRKDAEKMNLMKIWNRLKTAGRNKFKKNLIKKKNIEFFDFISKVLFLLHILK